MSRHIKDQKESLLLDVLICTYGKEGIRRVAAGKHPRMNGVRYLVSWQIDEEATIPATLDRDDFTIFTTKTKGLAVNRNIAFSHASAPLLLISDDDIDYSEEGLTAVINAFDQNKEADIITFRYSTDSHKKYYPSEPCDLAHPAKGYFTTSFEIALRRDVVKGRLWFNENFGIGAIFPAGEEDIFLRDCLDNGARGVFLPLTIARHEGVTTSGRNLMHPSRPQTKGAVFLRLHPNDWPLRMIVHAFREIALWRKGLAPSPFAYCRNWIKGVKMARKQKVFPTPDYSYKYPCHE